MAANQFTEANGHQLFADMLRDIHKEWRKHADSSTPEHDNWAACKALTIRRYLAKVQKSKSAELEARFFVAMTEFIGSTMDGAVPYPEFFEEGARHGR